MNSHLTDENVADLLAGESSVQVLAHLDRCEPCRIEAQRLCSALADFKQQSLAWAEARPAPGGGKRGVLLTFRQPTLAAAALVLACVAVGGVFRVVDPAPAVHQHAAGSLSDDNQLLLSIDQELNAQEPSPRDVYATNVAKNATRSAVSE